MKEVLGKSYKLRITDKAEDDMNEHTVGEVYIVDSVGGVIQVYKEKDEKR